MVTVNIKRFIRREIYREYPIQMRDLPSKGKYQETKTNSKKINPFKYLETINLKTCQHTISIRDGVRMDLYFECTD